jgi:hypothetical protein
MNKKFFVTSVICVSLNLDAFAFSSTSIAHQPNKKRPVPEEVMQKLDANKDNKISKEEAKGPLKKNFEKVDNNKDGYITLVEIKNAPKPLKKKDPK